MVVVVGAFILRSRLLLIEYERHRDSWEADGKPADYFFHIPGSYASVMFVSTAWLFVTPDWMKGDRSAWKMVVWYRVLILLLFVGAIAMGYLESKRS